MDQIARRDAGDETCFSNSGGAQNDDIVFEVVFNLFVERSLELIPSYFLPKLSFVQLLVWLVDRHSELRTATCACACACVHLPSRYELWRVAFNLWERLAFTSNRGMLVWGFYHFQQSGNPIGRPISIACGIAVEVHGATVSDSRAKLDTRGPQPEIERGGRLGVETRLCPLRSIKLHRLPSLFLPALSCLQPQLGSHKFIGVGSCRSLLWSLRDNEAFPKGLRQILSVLDLAIAVTRVGYRAFFFLENDTISLVCSH